MLLILSACTTVSPAPTIVPTPTEPPIPTPTQLSEREIFLRAVQDQVTKNDTIPQSGRDSVIAVIGNQPTYAFPENKGIVLQFNVFEMPTVEEDIKKTAILLIGVGHNVAGEYQVPITGIEVVYYLEDGEPWLALALEPPWDMTNNMRLAPLHPKYIKRLLDAGVITPTPEPTY